VHGGDETRNEGRESTIELRYEHRYRLTILDFLLFIKASSFICCKETSNHFLFQMGEEMNLLPSLFVTQC
jgi:hypothetical protein